MPSAVLCKGAPALVAPFAFWLLVTTALLAGHARPALASACPATKITEQVRVVYVYDGDTVKLSDGRRLRVIGINTPELGYKNRQTQPLAEAARTALQQLLEPTGGTLQLQHDKQDRDRYGRLLAHAFLMNGENIAVHLLQKGLATTLVVPPNTWGIHCYQALENDARLARKGLWALPEYQPQAARTLSPDTRGFRIVQGKVSGLRDSRYTLWIEIEGPLVLQIAKKDLANFDAPEALIGRQVEARGWIKQGQDGLRMKIQHPAALAAMTRSQR